MSHHPGAGGVPAAAYPSAFLGLPVDQATHEGRYLWPSLSAAGSPTASLLSGGMHPYSRLSPYDSFYYANRFSPGTCPTHPPQCSATCRNCSLAQQAGVGVSCDISISPLVCSCRRSLRRHGARAPDDIITRTYPPLTLYVLALFLFVTMSITSPP